MEFSRRLDRGLYDYEISGSLQAWDPVQQRQIWEVDYDHMYNAGTLTTAGNLVFQGTAEGHLMAYDASNGHDTLGERFRVRYLSTSNKLQD